MPGGVRALLAAAGLDASTPRAAALLDVIRVIHPVREGVQPPTDERRRSVLAHVSAVVDFDRALAAFPSGVVGLAVPARGRTDRRLLKAFGDAIGCSLEEQNRVLRYRVVPGEASAQRRARLVAAGLDVAGLETALNKGEPVSPALAADQVPLVLPEAAWRGLTGAARGDQAALFASLLADRQASLVYYGAFSMDEETRRHLAASPALLRQIHGSGRASILAAFGGSLRLRSGGVVTPGGPAAATLWEVLVGVPPTRPDRFILKVLGKDAGRLALLYEAVAHFDPPHQAFALGLWMTDPGVRLNRFKALYASCATALTGWDAVSRPFVRQLYDPAYALMVTQVAPSGAPVSLPWRRFWQKAFASEDLPDEPESEVRDVDGDGVFDAAWVIDLLLADGGSQGGGRVTTWTYAHRVFGLPPMAALPQVLVAVRGASRFRALSATLERLGAFDPAVIDAALRHAQRIADIGSRARAATALASFQGALALIERARLSRTIDADATVRLVGSLSRLPLTEGGEYLGGVAAWLDEELLPAVGLQTGAPVGAGGSPSLEHRLLAAVLGGDPSGRAGHLSRLEPARSASSPVIEYESVRYRLDPSVSELARVTAIRARQAGTTFDAEIGFAREVLAAARGISELSQLPGRVSSLNTAAGPILGRPRSKLAEQVPDAIAELSRILKPQDLSKVGSIVVPLQRAVDEGMGSVLASLAYAFALADPDSTLLVAGDPSAVHDWGLLAPVASARMGAAWTLASVSRDNGNRWRMSGSLLALDVALGDHALRPMTTEAPAEAPTVLDNDRAALTEAVTLANPLDYRDSDMTAIVDAIRRGRAKAARLASTPALLAEVSAASGLDETRCQALAWSLVHDRERVPAFFSFGELARLGGLSLDALEAADAWGTSGLSYDGRLCLRFPRTQPWSTLAGRRGRGLLPTLMPDLALLAAETLSDQRLPAALTRDLLAVATPDFFDRARLAYPDDWLAMIGEVQRLLLPRMDDYLAAVMTRGPLVPIDRTAGER